MEGEKKNKEVKKKVDRGPWGGLAPAVVRVAWGQSREPRETE